MTKKLRCLDLFSGIGGNALALRSICKTIAYCEIDPFARSILEANMAKKTLDKAPIFEDVTKLKATDLPALPDVITASFPCQDISFAGTGSGITGKNSGLYIHVLRIIEECAKSNHRVSYLMMENSPRIKDLGLELLLTALTKLGYKSKWSVFDAVSVGARHTRRRWFLVASHRTAPAIPPVKPFKYDFDALDAIPPLVRITGPESKKDARMRYCSLGNSVVPSVVTTAWNCLVNGTDPPERDLSRYPLLRYADGFTSRIWPTPVHSDTDWYASHKFTNRQMRYISNRIFYELGIQRRYGITDVIVSRGIWMINPEWIETLMGFPSRWTSVRGQP